MSASRFLIDALPGRSSPPTVVLKPSEEAPVSAGLMVAEIMAEAGFPAGVVNVVTHAPGEAVPVADEFFDRAEVRCINFTGSSATGRILAERAGRVLKRCVLELGGYNPLIVLADADLDYAVEATAFAAFFHSGQICIHRPGRSGPQSMADFTELPWITTRDGTGAYPSSPAHFTLARPALPAW